jgi:hypothetical protein
MRTWRRGLSIAVSALACGAGLVVSAPPTSAATAPPPPTVWLCRPGLADNPCEVDLTTTLYNAAGEVTDVRERAPAKDPDVDCFYVYPTVSDQPTAQANFDIDPELASIALYQAARYSSECRVFAPVYRQITIAAIGGVPVTPEMRETAYQDVRSAWLDYLANHNDGRGVVFIGHSQGSGVLRRLLLEEIDPDPARRQQLVSALLLGSNVTVAEGSDRGGDFEHIPACRSRRQLGCVVAFETFNAPVPPSSRFGRTDEPGLEVLCTNPASLGGGSGTIDAILPSAPFAEGTIIGAVIGILGLPPITATTPWVRYGNAHTAECSSEGGANVLQITPRKTTPLLNPAPDPTWGLHIADANIALGDLVRLVDRQAERWDDLNDED